MAEEGAQAAEFREEISELRAELQTQRNLLAVTRAKSDRDNESRALTGGIEEAQRLSTHPAGTKATNVVLGMARQAASGAGSPAADCCSWRGGHHQPGGLGQLHDPLVQRPGRGS